MKQGDSPASLEPGKHLLTEPFLNESEVYGNLLLSHNFVCNVKGRSALLRVQEFEGQGNTEAFEAPASSDQLVVVIPKGQGEVESFSDGFWRNATYQPGSVGMTPSGQTSRLRVRPPWPGSASHTALAHPDALFRECGGGVPSCRSAFSKTASQCSCILGPCCFTGCTLAQKTQSKQALLISMLRPPHSFWRHICCPNKAAGRLHFPTRGRRDGSWIGVWRLFWSI